MKVKYPDISVIISTYNRPKLLRRALLSVLSQDIEDVQLEVVVVDDASTENNLPVMESLDKHFTLKGISLLYFKMGENSGYQCKPKNIGVQQSNGEFIAYLDDDNVWKPNHLRVLWEAIQRHDCDMVYGMREYKATKDCKEPPGLGPGRIGPFIAENIKEGNFIDTSDILHSKGGYYQLAATDGKGWDEDLMRWGDWNFAYRWAMAGLSARPVYQIITEYWWHGDNLQLTRKPTDAPIQLTKDAFDASRSIHLNT
jgi:glycosyltransferase involved in cell wall biosynthesis